MSEKAMKWIDRPTDILRWKDVDWKAPLTEEDKEQVTLAEEMIKHLQAAKVEGTPPPWPSWCTTLEEKAHYVFSELDLKELNAKLNNYEVSDASL